MKRLLFLAAFAISSNASALLGDCPLKFAGGVVLEDKHHVGYALEVKNPTKKPVSFYVRLDFMYKGQKIQGGFEMVRATIPAGGKKTFRGTEPFTDTLKGVNDLRVTLRQCN